MLKITTMRALFAIELAGASMRRLSIVLFAFLLYSPLADAQTVTVVSASSTFPAGTEQGGFTSMTDDPLGPFSGESVTFVGSGGVGGDIQVYMYRLDFNQEVTLDSITVEGAAWTGDNGDPSTLRLLDANSVEVASKMVDVPVGEGNDFKSINFDLTGITGSTFFLEEVNDICCYRYRSNIEVKLAPNAPTVTVVSASSTYPAGTDKEGFVSMTDDPLGPFSGQSVTFRGTNQGGVTQVYKYQIDFDQEVTLDSIVVEGAAWRGDSISLTDDLDNEINTVQFDDGNIFLSHVLDVSGTTGRRFFLEEINTDTNWRYRSNIEIRLAGNTPPDTNGTEVRIRAFVDGRSQIKIQDNQLWWHHFDAAAPGLLNGANEPTIVNGFDWLPVWPFNDEGRGCNCESDKLDLSLVGLQLASDFELLELRVISGRDSAVLLQSPTAGNGFLSIIEFNDPSGGADWYEVVAVFAGEVPITVPGTSNPWLAGMPDGSTARGGDVAPDQSPVLAPIAITPGVAISFSATGLVSHCDCDLAGPDGDTSSYMAHSMENGMPDTNMPLNALAGVFLGPDQPDLSPTPPGLDFGAGGNVADGINYTDLSPGLKQVFFIGDGLTDTGVPQQITSPAGATRLYLGTNDLEGWFDNIGAFEVEVSGGVPPINEIPVAVNDSVNADTGVSVVISVLDNDQGLADTPIVVSILANPTNGTAIAGADNRITYTSIAGFVGDDNFQYTATDRDGDASSATVTVTVIDPDVNVIPIAMDDSVELASDFQFAGNAVIDVLANDQRLDDEPIAVTITQSPPNGSVFVLTDNRISYTVDLGFIGDDEFEYRVTDVDGDWASAKVTVTILPSTVADGSAGNTTRKKGGGTADPLWLLVLLLLILKSNRLRLRYH